MVLSLQNVFLHLMLSNSDLFVMSPVDFVPERKRDKFQFLETEKFQNSISSKIEQRINSYYVFNNVQIL